jgi:protein TonB
MVRRGGDVIAAMALYQPKPVYPPLARMARIQGTVVLQAILSRDGTIQDLKVLSGHPLLVQAALDAVRTWRYQPTLLNSEPVEVLTEIDVKFTLEE